jgi:hypothetical protein
MHINKRNQISERNMKKHAKTRELQPFKKKEIDESTVNFDLIEDILSR